jgi:hypothetical protein
VNDGRGLHPLTFIFAAIAVLAVTGAIGVFAVGPLVGAQDAVTALVSQERLPPDQCETAPGTLPTEVPQPYNSIFTAAAAKSDIEPAFLATIFYIEQGQRWPNPKGPWASSPAGAQGPFQFLASTFQLYLKVVPPGHTANIQSVRDSAYAAAAYLSELGGTVGATVGDPMNPKKGTLVWAAGAYNGGVPRIGNAENDAYRRNTAAVFLRLQSAVSGVKVIAIPNNTCMGITSADQAFGGKIIKARWVNGSWPVALPDFPGESCDPRIIGNVAMMARKYHFFVTDCYGGHPPHAIGGEHPVGAAVDAIPSDGDWGHAAQAAADVGWRPSCAASGCIGQVKAPFRAVFYNGYPGHGDPAHCSGGCAAHIHFSWERAGGAPYHPVAWVECFEDAYCRN